jgi:hypothetical protein
VVLRRSIRIGRAPSSLPGPHLARLPDVVFERTPRTKVETTLGLRPASSTGGPGPVLSSPPQGLVPPPGGQPFPTQRRNSSPEPFGSLPGAPIAPVSRQTSPRSVPRPADGVLVQEPVWERPAGPKLNARRPGRKLGQTRPARQGLVRVPESNTKYGGK